MRIEENTLCTSQHVNQASGFDAWFTVARSLVYFLHLLTTADFRMLHFVATRARLLIHENTTALLALVFGAGFSGHGALL
jgi:hypothetical protein